MKNTILALVFLLTSHLCAQIQHQGQPFGLETKSTRLNATSACIHLPSFTPPEQSMPEHIVHHKSLTFAHTFHVNVSPDNGGQWTSTAEGQRIWQVSFHSEGAASLNVIFSKFKLPEGGKVFIYNEDMSHIIGAFTHLNNKTSGVLPTLPVAGEQITIEYQAPENPSFEAELCIGSVNHDYLGIFEKVGQFGDAADCEKDASCYLDETYQLSTRSTVKLIIAGSELMTGTLINNSLQDGTPYIITAAHGFRDFAMSATSTLFIFNYQVPHCFTQVEGSREQSIAGGEMLCYSPNTDNEGLDFALVKLSTPPPSAYRPVFAGWSRSSSAPSQVHCIHHPQGDVKKISFDDHALSLSSLKTSDATYRDNGHWKVNTWEEGITEGGSSGAAIFNDKTQFLGALSGGAASCSYPRNDYFYRFDLAWDAPTNSDATLSQWLDSNQSDINEIAYYIPQEVSNTKHLSHITADSEVTAVTGDGIGNIAGNNDIGITRFVEKFEESDSSYIYGFYFVPSEGSSQSVVDINIWSGNTQPETRIYSAPLLIKRWGNSFSSSQVGYIGGQYLKTELALKDNFVLLPYDIGVKGNFFIGFEVDNAQQSSPFGMTLSNNNSANNAYYYDGEWHPYSELAGYNKATTLWIEPITSSQGRVTAINASKDENMTIRLWPNPVKQSQKLNINVTNTAAIAIYTIDGKRCQCAINTDHISTSTIDTGNLAKGSYLLKAEGKTFIFLKQ